MDAIADNSVALVVTSPPYFAGKEYEAELEREGVPSSYLEYLELLRSVFAECVRTLEPGGRIAVNVANLGRRPYRSLSADVIRILQDDLGLLLRGEVIWRKGEGATGSCAWGSFRGASNPVLRDITERIIVASKGRFDRARSLAKRSKEQLPHESTLMADDFMTLTLDVWEIPAESARRVGHPAPFPVELPEQLIRLYTFRDDLVLDPFMGSGSALVAAARLGRRYIGYDLDPAYVDIARQRVAGEASPGELDQPSAWPYDVGMGASKLAENVLLDAGFTIEATDKRIPKTGVKVAFVAVDGEGGKWFFDLAGPFTTHRPGLTRTEAVWRALGRAHAVRGGGPPGVPYVLLAPGLPVPKSEAAAALRAAGPDAFFAAIDLLSEADRERLKVFAKISVPRAP